ncbi:MAG TPA: hypothetical protein VLG47_07045 [Candidatus Saccharimonadales bacterium]|nr:hypothetical protein [Candidatus Saccharimonadales bacterium]
MPESEHYPRRLVFVTDVESAEQHELLRARVAEVAAESGLVIAQHVLDYQPLADEIALQRRLAQTLMFSGEYSAPFTRVAKALTRDNVTTFSDIFALGEIRLAKVHGIKKPSVEVIKAYLIEKFPDIDLLMDPAAEDIAKYCNSVGLVDARAVREMPPHIHKPSRVTVEDLISHRSREAFKPPLSPPDALFEDDAAWRERYYSAVSLAHAFARDFYSARTRDVDVR